MRKIVFTGFEPFGGAKINPSWEAVKALPEVCEDFQIIRLLLPVEYDSVKTPLREIIEQEKPDAVLCVGQAGGRTMLTPEFVAINWKDAAVPDNAGVFCEGERIEADGPDAYFATVPVKRMTEAMRAAGVPAGVSYTAGAYVCNSTMYTLLHLLSEFSPETLGGFIHIPFANEQVTETPAYASLSLEVMTRGLLEAAKAVMKSARDGGVDLRRAEGTTC